jgi:hypothetical protein
MLSILFYFFFFVNTLILEHIITSLCNCISHRDPGLINSLLESSAERSEYIIIMAKRTLSINISIERRPFFHCSRAVQRVYTAYQSS